LVLLEYKYKNTLFPEKYKERKCILKFRPKGLPLLPTAIHACRYCSGLIVGALNGEEKEALLSDHYCPVPGD
jgi:hypothetical protein